MARIRTIKPEFWKHEQLGRMSFGARLTFVGMMSMADDEGRGQADPEHLWGQLHSYTPPSGKAVWKRIMGELRAVKDNRGPLVVFYRVGGAAYYWLPGFNRQQRIDEPSPSKLPTPPNSGNAPGAVREGSALEGRGGDQGSGKGRERRGGEGNPTPREASPGGTADPGIPEGAQPESSGGEQGELRPETIAAAYTVQDPTVPPDKALNHVLGYQERGGELRAALEAVQQSGKRLKLWTILDSLLDTKPKNGLGPPAGVPKNPEYLKVSRVDVQARQDAARKAVDERLETLPEDEKAGWTSEAEASARARKLSGTGFKLFVTAELRKRAASKFGIEGV